MIDLQIGGAVLKGIDLIIFDKDGTLFQLYPYWSRMALLRGRCICRALAETACSAGPRPASLPPGLAEWIALQMGVDLASGRINPQGPIGIESRQNIQALLCRRLEERGYTVDIEVMREAFRQADAYFSQEETIAESHVPVAGMTGLLMSLKGICRCAMLSHDTTLKLELSARSQGIAGCFQMYLGSDRCAFSKPHPWGAQEIMARLGARPERTAFMGDSINDLKCGRDAGCGYILAVLSEISNIEEMGSLADAAVRDYHEIKVRRGLID